MIDIPSRAVAWALDDRAVWITTSWKSDRDVYHLTGDCARLPNDDEQYVVVARSGTRGREPCQDPDCAGVTDRNGGAVERECPVCETMIDIQLGSHLRYKCEGEA